MYFIFTWDLSNPSVRAGREGYVYFPSLFLARARTPSIVANVEEPMFRPVHTAVPPSFPLSIQMYVE